MAASDPRHAALLAELGIGEDYGTNPPLPRYAEAGELEDIGPNIIGRPQQLAPATASAWREMCAAAANDKVTLLVVSGFRSVDYQAMLIRKKLDQGQRIDDILKVNVAPGYSQHHTGHAIDVATPGYKPLLEEFDESPAFEWLNAYAGDFGFVLSYPRDNPLGVIYEPWHWYRDDGE
jgi:D-alanyl-D-alanine carboxypeptidase